MPTSWRLWIDESGRFDTDDSEVCLGGVLVPPAHLTELARLDCTLAAYLPFIPRPLHARHLRAPLYLALCWHARGPASMTADERRRLSAASRAAIASLAAGGSPTADELAVAAIELAGVPVEQDRLPLRRDLLRLLRHANDNPALPTLQDLGWPAAVGDAIAALKADDAERLRALLAEVELGRRPDVQSLDRLGKRLKRRHPGTWQRLASGQRVVVSWVRRVVAVAGSAQGAVVPVVAAQALPAGGAARYTELFDVLCRRALRAVAQPGTGGGVELGAELPEPSALRIDAARVSRRLGEKHYETVWSVEELDKRAHRQALLPYTATVDVVHTPGYDQQPHVGLELADWVANCALRLVKSAPDLPALLAALSDCAGLAPSRDSWPLVAASQAPAAWLEAALVGAANAPVASRSERAWAWQQAARWAELYGQGAPSPAGVDHA